MFQIASTWITTAALAGGGLYNSLGGSALEVDDVRCGYPAWWCYVTGALALVAVPATRSMGLTLGALIVAVAVLTIARRREFAHLPPLGIFAGLLVATALP